MIPVVSLNIEPTPRQRKKKDYALQPKSVKFGSTSPNGDLSETHLYGLMTALTESS